MLDIKEDKIKYIIYAKKSGFDTAACANSEQAITCWRTAWEYK